MEELEDYYNAFNIYSIDKLDEFVAKAKNSVSDGLKFLQKQLQIYFEVYGLKFLQMQLQIYFEVYAAQVDNFKYRVLYDEFNPKKYFYRH